MKMMKLADLEAAFEKDEIMFNYCFDERCGCWYESNIKSNHYDYCLAIDDKRDRVKTYLCWHKGSDEGNIYCIGKPKGVKKK